MRTLILTLASILLAACAAPTEPRPGPVGTASPRVPAATHRVNPTATMAPLLKPTSRPTSKPTSMPTASPGFRANLPDLGEAPELNNEVWLNTDRPLRLADLRGRVVLIDMWTFG